MTVHHGEDKLDIRPIIFMVRAQIEENQGLFWERFGERRFIRKAQLADVYRLLQYRHALEAAGMPTGFPEDWYTIQWDACRPVDDLRPVEVTLNHPPRGTNESCEGC